MVPPKDGFMDLDNHPATTPEIRSLCADLGVLGRVDFKNLLKWRLAVRKTRKLDGKKKAALRGGVVSTGEDGTDSESDEDITGLDDKNEMASVMSWQLTLAVLAVVHPACPANRSELRAKKLAQVLNL